ncbi:MAG: hypothetical protein ACI865_002350 [Flavobacteriaceae bacterium]|jgi:hypothetical protein
MKRQVIAAICTIGISLGSSAQEKDSSWTLKAIYGVNGTQSSFVNWNAGGRNNISVLAYIVASAKYKKDNIKWDNDLGLALGGIQYIDKGATEDLQKTDDRIELATNFGYKLKEHYYISFLAGFRTQFLDGFTDVSQPRTSKFMAPGYVNIALGLDFTPTDNFSLFISPLASKMTFVQDETLANAGAFGVDPAVFDDVTGLMTAPGKMFRPEFGAYFKMKYAKEIFKNIEMKTKLELFSNYIENPQNIDVNAEVLFTFKVNDWFSASLNWNLIYDHDIQITDINGNTGPRTQFKSVLGLGLSYIMKN